MYRIRIVKAATGDLERLDKPVSRRITERINWLAAHFVEIGPERFTADLQAFTNSALVIIGLFTRFITKRLLSYIKSTIADKSIESGSEFKAI